jgi:phosphate transport system protein
MSHYEERLEADVAEIRRRIAGVGAKVLAAQQNAVRALLSGDRDLAGETILGDLPINREVRAIDRECHAFVARHLPSAGHLRFVSSVLRLNIELERIGDYAVSVCREALRLSASPSPTVQRDVELMADQSRRVLSQALRAWNEANAELARGTLGMAGQVAGTFHKVFADLLREGEADRRPLKDLFALLAIFVRLSRVADQSKNICEETLFTVTGESKPPKVYRILFVDERNDCQSQLAEAYARKAYPESGRYSSAGWAPAQTVEPRCLSFMDRNRLDTGGLEPTALDSLHGQLSSYHVIVSLGGDVRPHVPEVPYSTTVLEWDVGRGPEGMDQERAEKLLAEMTRRIAEEVRELMATLRGEGAS